MFLNSFGFNTFQVSQFSQLQDLYIPDSFIFHQSLDCSFYLEVLLCSRSGSSNKTTAVLVTQKNELRKFKSIDSLFRLIQPLCYETKADKPFKNNGSLNIKIKMLGDIYGE